MKINITMPLFSHSYLQRFFFFTLFIADMTLLLCKIILCQKHKNQGCIMQLEALIKEIQISTVFMLSFWHRPIFCLGTHHGLFSHGQKVNGFFPIPLAPFLHCVRDRGRTYCPIICAKTLASNELPLGDYINKTSRIESMWLQYQQN